MRRRCRSLRGSGSGIAESSACVYGCAGRSKTSSTSPISTIRPRYITATRSAMWRTTDKSCATNRYDSAELDLQPLEQVDDAGANRYVERRDRLVEHEQLRLERERARDADALALAAGKLPADSGSTCSGRSPTSSSSSRTRRVHASAAHAVRRERLGEDVADRQARIERGQRILEDHLQIAADRESLRVRHPRGVAGRARRSLPAIGRTRFRISMIVVVLPQPDSPTSPSVSPSRMSKLMPSTACTVPTRRRSSAPFVSGYSFTRSRTSSTVERCARGSDAPARGRRGRHAEDVAARQSARFDLARCDGRRRSDPRRTRQRSRASARPRRTSSMRIGQRGTNGHPGGSATSDGGLPSIGVSGCRRRRRAAESIRAGPACTASAGGRTHRRPRRSRRACPRTSRRRDRRSRRSRRGRA